MWNPGGRYLTFMLRHPKYLDKCSFKLSSAPETRSSIKILKKWDQKIIILFFSHNDNRKFDRRSRKLALCSHENGPANVDCLSHLEHTKESMRLKMYWNALLSINHLQMLCRFTKEICYRIWSVIVNYLEEPISKVTMPQLEVGITSATATVHQLNMN